MIHSVPVFTGREEFDIIPFVAKEGETAMSEEIVRAAIELKITPARDTGFGRIAERVARFEQVEACFLMSGGYDLLVFVQGKSLQDVAHFVSAELSTIDGVLSTATHFMLKTYKAKGEFADPSMGTDQRLPVV
jgi:DNA-binding Lrp family transcriptional regulator